MDTRKDGKAKGVNTRLGQQVYTDMEIKEYLIELQNRLDRIPTINDVRVDENGISYQTFYRRGNKTFKWWLAETFNGFVRKRKPRITDKQLIMYLKQYHKEFDKTPTQQDISDAAGYPSGAIFTRRGGMGKYLKLAGFSVNKIHRHQDGELIELLISLSEDLGKTPTSGDMMRARKKNPDKWPHIDAYFSRNTWHNWLQKSGLRKQPYKYTEEELETALRKAGEIIGRAPTSKEFDTLEGFPSSSNYMKRGGWLNWLDRCELKYTPTNNFFGAKITTKDGHNVRSSEEAQIDDWLFNNNFVHMYEPYYPKQKKYKADFCVNGIYYEYYGLAGVHTKYDSRLQKKITYAKDNNIPLILIYRKDLDNLEKIFLQ